MDEQESKSTQLSHDLLRQNLILKEDLWTNLITKEYHKMHHCKSDTSGFHATPILVSTVAERWKGWQCNIMWNMISGHQCEKVLLQERMSPQELKPIIGFIWKDRLYVWVVGGDWFGLCKMTALSTSNVISTILHIYCNRTWICQIELSLAIYQHMENGNEPAVECAQMLHQAWCVMDQWLFKKMRTWDLQWALGFFLGFVHITFLFPRKHA